MRVLALGTDRRLGKAVVRYTAGIETTGDVQHFTQTEMRTAVLVCIVSSSAVCQIVAHSGVPWYSSTRIF